MVLAGNVDFLTKPVMAFVRLCEGQCLSEILEVPLPVRFLFLVMGPTNTTVDCHEVGRSISTLMSNHVSTLAYVWPTTVDRGEGVSLR